MAASLVLVVLFAIPAEGGESGDIHVMTYETVVPEVLALEGTPAPGVGP
ncbi:MAG: hypothetical protein JW910_01990 [Anaerolineae bacterium]|nr:hypothetical protein [Anaerolineae bacterium]